MQRDSNKQNYAEIFDVEQEAESAIHAKFKGVYSLLWMIAGTLVVAVIAMLLTVFGLIVDAWRWKSNSYSEMVRVMDSKNQELITKEFDEIKEILNKNEDVANSQQTAEVEAPAATQSQTTEIQSPIVLQPQPAKAAE
ncbi:MAG: hypothetical protein WC304_04080 [Candidatus Gracilibacteria bacterium]|jgi:Tfp pilus assembly protein PilN